MWSGNPVDGPAFYSLLCTSDEFCAELGRATLAAGRLESALKQHVMCHARQLDLAHATLGQLIAVAKKENLLSEMIPPLELLKSQRNYLAHNIHSLLSGTIIETILEGSNLIDSDVTTYTERAWQLADNLNALSEILERERANL